MTTRRFHLQAPKYNVTIASPSIMRLSSDACSVPATSPCMPIHVFPLPRVRSPSHVYPPSALFVTRLTPLMTDVPFLVCCRCADDLSVRSSQVYGDTFGVRRYDEYKPGRRNAYRNGPFLDR